MRWHSHLRGLIHNVGRRVEHNLGGNENYPDIVTHSLHSTGDSVALKLPYLNGPRPLYQFLQQLRICTSRRLLADSSNDATPISSPLTPVLAPGSGKAEGQAVVAKPGKVHAVLKGIKQMRLQTLY